MRSSVSSKSTLRQSDTSPTGRVILERLAEVLAAGGGVGEDLNRAPLQLRGRKPLGVVAELSRAVSLRRFTPLQTGLVRGEPELVDDVGQRESTPPVEARWARTVSASRCHRSLTGAARTARKA